MTTEASNGLELRSLITQDGTFGSVLNPSKQVSLARAN